MPRRARWLDVLELDLDPRTPVSQLNVAKMQLVEIAKALSLRSRVLLLDEPTASLTPHETLVLFGLLRKLRDEGVEHAVRQPQAGGGAGDLRRSDGAARRPQRLREPADGGTRSGRISCG